MIDTVARDDATLHAGQAALRRRLATDGWALVDLGERATARLVQPWLLVDGLLGVGPQLTEVQPIRPVASARSFAASMGPAPLHTDSQQWRGRPAELQLTACLHAADDGGDSLLVDGFAVAAGLGREDPDLLDALLHRHRHLPFVFGDVFGPTLARRSDRYVVTHTPHPIASDPVGPALARALSGAAVQRVRIEPHQALLVDNHRMLHGRDAFTDPRRELLRTLAWLPEPLGPRPPWGDAADAVWRALDARLAGAPVEVRRAFGLPEPGLGLLEGAVLAMLSGAPPGALARRLGVDEATLYRRRDGLLAAPAVADPQPAVGPTSRPDPGSDPGSACRRALEELARDWAVRRGPDNRPPSGY